MTVVLWTLAGLLLVGALAFGIGLLWLTYGDLSQREGAAAMGVIFFVTPAGAILGAIVDWYWGLSGGAADRGGRQPCTSGFATLA